LATYDPAAIEQAMADAVVLANAQGITDPEQVKARMITAQKEYMRECDEREIIDKANAENAASQASR
jgi:hypothetical protein